MRKLLSANLYRALKHKGMLIISIILLVVSIGLITALTLTNYRSVEESGSSADLISASSVIIFGINPISFPMGALFVFIIIFIGRNWQTRTFRMPILAGESRVKIFFSTYLFAFIMMAYFLALYILPILLIGAIVPKEITPILAKGETFAIFAEKLLVMFLNIIMWLIIAVFLATSLHNPVGALFVFVGAMFIISTVNSVIWISSMDLTENIPTYKFTEFLSSYQCERAIGGSVVERLFSGLISGGNPNSLDIYRAPVATENGYEMKYLSGGATRLIIKTVSTTVIFSGLFTFIGTYVFANRDLK